MAFSDPLDLSSDDEANEDELRKFCRKLMIEFKKRLQRDGITPAQARWLSHRASDWSVTIEGLTTSHDLMSMAWVGSAEQMFEILSYSAPDDMSEPHHAWSQERIDWLKSQIASYMGWA